MTGGRPSRFGGSVTLALVGAVALVAGACGGGAGDPQAGPTTTQVAPSPPSTSVEQAAPGSLLTMEELDSGDLDAMVWSVRYRSVGLADELIEVTGVVARPSSDPPPGGWPVVSWAHGTTGIADPCAPSTFGAAAVPLLQGYLDAGFVVVATDYQGLGTDGMHPYLVVQSEGRSVLDIARAATEVVPEATGPVVLNGHSQGGHAVLSAASIAADWAPEMAIAGVVAIAPATDLRAAFGRFTKTAAAFDLVAYVAASWGEVYDTVSTDDVLGPTGSDFAARIVDDTCGVGAEAFDRSIEELFAADLTSRPAWRTLFEQNTPDAASIGLPTLVVQGSDDAVIVASDTEAYVAAMCAAGGEVQYEVLEGGDHTTALTDTQGGVLQWLAGRLAGGPVDSDCP